MLTTKAGPFHPELAEPIRCVIVDDHEMLRYGVRRLLEDAPEFTVVGEAGDAAEALKLVLEHRPDLVLLDISMPGMSSFEAGRLTTIVIQIHHAKPGIEHPQVLVNEETVDWDHLRERLRDVFAIRVERIAYLEAHDDIDFQDVADVIAIARIAGVDRVGLLTEDGKHVPMAG